MQVSKLDTCEFSSERFLGIKAALEPFLRTCGFKEGSVQWLPAVGPTGENLVKPAEVCRHNSTIKVSTHAKLTGKWVA
jgi:translation elongation factor EF-1alpha